MAAKTPSKGKKASGAKAPKKGAAPKAAKKAAAPVVEEEAPAAEEADDDDFDGEGDEEAPRPVAKPVAPVAKKPAASARRGHNMGEDAPAVVPARRLTPEAKARVNEMVKKGMSLSDALKVAASWETFVAPVKDEPAKLVQGRTAGGGGGNTGGGAVATGSEPRSNFAGETDPEDMPESTDEEEPAAADEE
jgi:hypothetical protein